MQTNKLRSKPITTFIALLCLSATVAFPADKKIIVPPGTEPGGNYSPGILVDDTLYISGQAGEDSSGQIPKDFDAEVKQSLSNIGTVLKAAGMSPADVVSVQIYLAIYKEYFQDPRPTRTTVVVAKLVGPGHIEITVTARKANTERAVTASRIKAP
jgi:2-iminobutanoate/2-iminopropanoate deaminase